MTIPQRMGWKRSFGFVQQLLLFLKQENIENMKIYENILTTEVEE